MGQTYPTGQIFPIGLVVQYYSHLIDLTQITLRRQAAVDKITPVARLRLEHGNS